ncbi:hypothetical protein [Sphingomonas sp. CROZ-RG-20F-R02-07]|uniref:hypothetical protein n=1 Tax=Sphingomonas sp. CROZ-RG-20F-R02-07 TaxID=2914832 RepID=UPI001F57DC94|nr:hypothetical protein [Sphingomonas sp. CROZ-RG-20F-R02-07]
MIRFTAFRFSAEGDNLQGALRGTTAPITPRLVESSQEISVEVSAEEAIAITLIDIREMLGLMLQKRDEACPD